MRWMVRRATVAVFAASFVAAWSADSQPAVAQQALPGLRLYVFDCGYLINLSPETYNLTRVHGELIDLEHFVDFARRVANS